MMRKLCFPCVAIALCAAAVFAPLALAAEPGGGRRPSLTFGAIPDDLRPWSRRVAAAFPAWAAMIARRIPPTQPVGEVTLLLREDDGFVAFATGRTMVVSAPYLRKAPDDVGVVGHELVHMFQNHAARVDGWLIEGVADYLRYYVLEPGSARARFGEGASYRDGYQAAAWLLRHVERRHGCGVILALHASMRSGAYDAGFWRRRTGLDLDLLWEAAATEARRNPALLKRASRC